MTPTSTPITPKKVIRSTPVTPITNSTRPTAPMITPISRWSMSSIFLLSAMFLRSLYLDLPHEISPTFRSGMNPEFRKPPSIGIAAPLM